MKSPEREPEKQSEFLPEVLKFAGKVLLFAFGVELAHDILAGRH